MMLEEQRHGRWNDEDRLSLARLLIKGGYQVAIRKIRPSGKKTYTTYIEAIGDRKGAEQ